MQNKITDMFLNSFRWNKIKNWINPDFSKIDADVVKLFYEQTTKSLYFLALIVLSVSFFLFLVSLVTDINSVELLVSLSSFFWIFLIVLSVHKLSKNDQVDYWLLIIVITLILSWGVTKDMANYDVESNRFGMLYVILIFFGMTFMPFRPLASIYLGIYCSLLFSLVWIIMIYRPFGTDWLEVVEPVIPNFIYSHLDYWSKKDYQVVHTGFFAAWQFLQFLLYGLFAAFFRAANFQLLLNTFQTNKQLQITEEDLRATKSLLFKSESQFIEFKSSARFDYHIQRANKDLEKSIVKTISAFMNSEGGTLILGIDDDKNILGLENDYQTLAKKDRDGYELFIVGLVGRFLGKELCSNISVSFLDIEGKDVCLVKISKNNKPVFIEKMDQSLYVRTGNNTQKLNTKEAVEYIQKQFNQ